MTKIELYRDEHFDGVDRLWRDVFPGDAPRNQAAQSIPAKLAMADDLLWVAISGDGEIIGTIMAGFDGHRGWLYSVAVANGERRKGIGMKLVNTALAELKQRGCTKVNLQIREGNERVAAFYRSIGFEIEPRISMGRTI